MTTPPPAARTKTPPALWALALGAFGIGMTEFVPIGLLPQVAAEFDVSIPLAGWVMTSYAAGVMLGAPIMVALGLRLPRRRMLILLMTIFVLGNAATALAQAFPLLLTGRVVTAFAHGAFMGTGTVVAAALVAPTRRAAAVAFMLSGMTVANLVGVPIGTWLGTVAGWRWTFAAMAIVGLVTVLALGRLVPDLPRPAGASLRREVRAAGDVHVVLAMLATLLGFGGVFAAITYLTPMMTEVAGFSQGSMTWLLAVLGAGMVVGNWAGGRVADRSLTTALLGSLGLLALALAAFVFTAQSPPAAVVNVFSIGALGFASVPPLQTLVLTRASSAPNLAAALNVGAFNLGNALAAWLGGVAIDAGLGYTAPNWVGAAMTTAGLTLATISIVLLRQRPTSRTVTDELHTGVVRQP